MAARIKQYATHTIQDASLSVNTALGANALSTSTNAIDLGAEKPFPTTGRFTVQLAVTATANGANSKNVNISLQDSDVNLAANFVNIAIIGPWVLAMTTGNIAAATRNIALPPATRQFVRILCATESSGGNPNDATATLSLLF